MKVRACLVNLHARALAHTKWVSVLTGAQGMDHFNVLMRQKNHLASKCSRHCKGKDMQTSKFQTCAYTCSWACTAVGSAASKA
eukprot:1137851-Pelagomonas_calceolata.AAC.3